MIFFSKRIILPLPTQDQDDLVIALDNFKDSDDVIQGKQTTYDKDEEIVPVRVRSSYLGSFQLWALPRGLPWYFF